MDFFSFLNKPIQKAASSWYFPANNYDTEELWNVLLRRNIKLIMVIYGKSWQSGMNFGYVTENGVNRNDILILIHKFLRTYCHNFSNPL